MCSFLFWFFAIGMICGADTTGDWLLIGVFLYFGTILFED